MKKYFRQRSRVCDVCVANMGEGFEKARTAYTLLADVNKFASDSEHYSGKFYFFIFHYHLFFLDQNNEIQHQNQMHL